MTTAVTAPDDDWTKAERRIMEQHGWSVDDDGTVRAAGRKHPIPLTTVLATLAADLTPQSRPVPPTLTRTQLAFLAEHGLKVSNGAIVTSDGEPVSKQLLRHLLARYEDEYDAGPSPSPLHVGSRSSHVARALGLQSSRTPWF